MKKSYSVYLTKEAVRYLAKTVLMHDFSINGVFSCESLEQDSQFLVMRVIPPPDLPFEGILEAQIPPHYVSYILCADRKQLPGFLKVGRSARKLGLSNQP